MLTDGKHLAIDRPHRSKPRIANLMIVTVIGLGLVATILVVRSAVRQRVSFDYPVYESIESLDAASDLIVVGEMGEVVHRFTDRGGDPEVDESGDPIRGIPMKVVLVRVTRSSSPEVLPGETLPVLLVDTDKVNAEGLSNLKSGDNVVLYLSLRTVAQAPDLSGFGDVWAPISGDNGVMDIVGDRVVPRLHDLDLELSVADVIP